MPVYIGSLGRMVKLPYVGSQQVQAEERYNFSSTLEGKRKAQVKPNGPRTWALSADHFRPNEHSLLSQFADGAWGNGPFVFVSADAPVSNMLTPDGAACKNVVTSGASLGGPALCSDGTWSAQSLLTGGASSVFFQTERMPVVPGSQVTVSAEVLGSGGRVSVSFFTATGTFISTVMSPSSAVAGQMTRLSVTTVVPSTAAAANVAVQNAVQATRPQLTWTDRLMPWSDGQGCAKAVVHGVSRDQVLAVQGHTFSNVGFTVSEVG